MIDIRSERSSGRLLIGRINGSSFFVSRICFRYNLYQADMTNLCSFWSDINEELHVSEAGPITSRLVIYTA